MKFDMIVGLARAALMSELVKLFAAPTGVECSKCNLSVDLTAPSSTNDVTFCMTDVKSAD